MAVATLLYSGANDFLVGYSSTLAAVAASFIGDPVALAQVINPAVLAAERRAPEGVRMEIVFDNFRAYVPLQGEVSVAGQVAAAINQQFAAGRIVDPASGESMKPWPEYPTQVAWSDDSQAQLVLRWRKGQPWLVYLLAAAVVVAAILYLALGHSRYSLRSIVQSATTPGPGNIGGTLVFGIPLWAWLALFAGAYIAPDIIRDWRRIKAAERGMGRG